ncbi:MAG: hypothetical protein FJY10_02200 [Bacteroidetes bacterium]|nr:hypothetical protein [Bacteroidota bacterium]
MQTLVPILQMTIPVIVLFIMIYLMLRAFLDHEHKKMALNIRAEQDKQLSPVKMQAYERLVLLLERIMPENLILRVSQPGDTVLSLQSSMIKAIREEYEYNMSQQLYVSALAWEGLIKSRDFLITLINTSASELSPGDPATELAIRILTKINQENINMVSNSLTTLKEEFQKSF